MSKLWRLWVYELKVEPATSLGAYSAIIVFLGAAALYVAEHGSNEKVNSYADAIWLTLVTLTTVGYGDVYPVTPLGRIIGMALALLGIGFLASFTAAIAAQVTGNPEASKSEDELAA